MTAVAEVAVTGPGMYDDLPEELYHADPMPGGSLSSTGARKIIQTCPALFRHEQLNGRPPKDVFDFGHAAHKKVLGIGLPIHEVQCTDWKTKAAQDARKAARAVGEVALLTAEVQVIEEMAAAILAHPIASALFNPAAGKPEQSLFWHDREHGINRRCRIDWLSNGVEGRRLILTDYKTTKSADPRSIAKDVVNYGYHQQADFYRDGAIALGLDDDPAFVFVFQEKTAPYLVTVVQLDSVALSIGRDLNERAMATYAECLASGRWPGYSDDVELISLPNWAIYQHEESM